MQQIKIITPDPIVETLLTLRTERLPEPEESAVLLDAAGGCGGELRPDPAVKIILSYNTKLPEDLLEWNKL